MRDVTDICDELGLRIDAAAAFSGGKPARPIDARKASANLFSESALLLLSRRDPRPAAVAVPSKAKDDLFG